MPYFLKDTKGAGFYFKELIFVPDEPNLLEIELTPYEEEAFDFEDEGQGALALSILDSGGARFVGHRPPKPSGH